MEVGVTFTQLIALSGLWLTIGIVAATAIHKGAATRLDNHGVRIDKLIEAINALTIQVTRQNGRIGRLEDRTDRLENRTGK